MLMHAERSMPMEDERTLARIAEEAEASGWFDLFQAAPPAFVAATGIRAERREGGCLLRLPAAPTPLFNRFFGFGLGHPIGEAALDEALAALREVGPFAVALSPFARPEALPQWLAARGLTPGGSLEILIREAAPPAPAETRLEVNAIGPERAAAFAQILSAGFEAPDFLNPWTEASVGRTGWRHYLAEDEEGPAACAALFIRGEVGWLAAAATRPDRRRRGAQSALIARRIADAAQAGCRWLTVETAEDRPEAPNPSLHNLRRAGFRRLYLRPSYFPTPAA